MRATRTGELVVIWSESRSTSEAWVVDAARPGAPRRGRSAAGGTASLYHVEHAPAGGDRLLVVTNDDAVEFRLMTAPGARATPTRTTPRWTEARPENPDERLLRRRRLRRTRSCSPTAPTASTGCASCRHDDLAGDGHRRPQPRRGRLRRPGPQRAVRRRAR